MKETIDVSMPPAVEALEALLRRLGDLRDRQRAADAAAPTLAEAAAAAAARADAAAVAVQLGDLTPTEAADLRRAAEEAAADLRDNGRLRGSLAVAVAQVESDVVAAFGPAADGFSAWCVARAEAGLPRYRRAAGDALAAAAAVGAWRGLAGMPLSFGAVTLPADLMNVAEVKLRAEDAPLPETADFQRAVDAAAGIEEARRIVAAVERRAA